jgi:hypothetical protein
MNLEERAAELARRTGVRVDQALALARAGSLDLFAFQGVVDAVVEAELKRGECRAEDAASRRGEIEQALADLAAAGETPGAERSLPPPDRPPRR